MSSEIPTEDSLPQDSVLRPIEAQGRDIAQHISRGLCRAFRQWGFTPAPEITLSQPKSKHNRRADVMALSRDGQITIAEIKSCPADFLSDQKWQDYEAFCDHFYFAVNTDFPIDHLPEACGLIIADAYSAEIIRPAPLHKLTAPRRKAVTLAFARQSAARLHRLLDPGLEAYNQVG